MPSLSLITFALLTTPLSLAAPAPASNQITKRITTPFFKKYNAIGDSYASGIGAGQYTDSAFSEGWKCSRFTDAYGWQLHKALNDPEQRSFSLKACAGAKAERIRDEQHVDQDADLITISAGGNNVGFSNLVDGCVFRFRGWKSPNCESAMDESEARIRDNSSTSHPRPLSPLSCMKWLFTNSSLGLWNPVWDAIAQVLIDLGPNAKTSRIFVTGYAKFFNSETDQCDGASFSVWALPGIGDKMTKDRRRRLNGLVDLINQQLQSVVDNWRNEGGYTNIQFINYDSAYEGHRLCENGISEPQRGSETHESHNPNAYFFQITKSSGSASLAGGDDAGREWAQWLHDAKAQNSSLEVNEAYRDIIEVNPGDDFSGGYPLMISKVMHPSSPGHTAIKDAILNTMNRDIQSAQNHQYGDIQYGPSQFCPGLGPGGGSGDCIDIKDGCYIVKPVDNTVPTPVCD